MYVVYNKFKGYLSEDTETGLYYSESITDETIKTETKDGAELLCNIYETAVKVGD